MSNISQFDFKILPTSIGGETVFTINARELHTELGIGKVFAAWIVERVSKYEFVENQDFTVTVSKVGIRSNVIQKDYHISLDMAKELAMVENNAKGRAIRKYFIECEKELRNIKKEDVFPVPTNLKEACLIAIKLFDENVELKAKIAEDAPKVEMYDKMADSEVELSLSTMAHLLRNINIDIGRTRLINLFRTWGWYKKTTPEPTQVAINNGLFSVKQTFVPGLNKTIGVGKLTWKGELACIDKMKQLDLEELKKVNAAIIEA